MKRIAAIALFTLLPAALVLSAVEGCAPPASAPLATYTPLPTYTPYPTYTPLPTYTPPPTSAPASAAKGPLPAPTAPAARCIAWTDAAAHMGETTCVRGTVYSTNKSGSTFFIDFDNTRTSFYGVSFRQTWDNLRGKCVEISGKISPYNGRPQIIIDSQEQVSECE